MTAASEPSHGIDRWDALAESYGTSPVIASLAHVLVELVDVSPGESVIDIGTGTGLALIAAAQSRELGPLVGLDRSLGMLKKASGRVAEADLVHVDLVRADAALLPVRDASFDVALAASVWQFLGRSQEALAEWRRVLRPGGRLGFSVPGPGSSASIPADLLAKYSHGRNEEGQVSRTAPDPVSEVSEAAAAAGFSDARVAVLSTDHTLPRAEDWWSIQWTHGIRFFLEKLDPDSLEALKREAVDRLVRSDSGEIVVTTNTVYCVAHY